MSASELNRCGLFSRSLVPGKAVCPYLVCVPTAAANGGRRGRNYKSNMRTRRGTGTCRPAGGRGRRQSSGREVPELLIGCRVSLWLQDCGSVGLWSSRRRTPRSLPGILSCSAQLSAWQRLGRMLDPGATRSPASAPAPSAHRPAPRRGPRAPRPHRCVWLESRLREAGVGTPQLRTRPGSQ